MTHVADPDFLIQLKKYGQVNIESCFNCGNCTAICPLSSGNDNFPRRMIRYGQLGLKDKLLSSRELWLCYSCGECTSTCPRQADPGEFMAAARRFAIAGYDRLRLARAMYVSPTVNLLVMFLLSSAIAAALYSASGPMSEHSLELFSFIPAVTIHYGGIAVGLAVFVLGLLGAVTMVRSLRAETVSGGETRLDRKSALARTIKEFFTQLNYKRDCNQNESGTAWYLKKWFLHAALFWGFVGLFLATSSDYLLELVGLRAIGSWVPIWYPVRLLGTLSGSAVLYSVTAIFVRRIRKDNESYRYSSVSDWYFLAVIWLSVATGLALEFAIYLPGPHQWSYWMLLAHLVFVGELIILLPYTKFAHIIYRTIAVYYHSLRQVPPTELAEDK